MERKGIELESKSEIFAGPQQWIYSVALHVLSQAQHDETGASLFPSFPRAGLTTVSVVPLEGGGLPINCRLFTTLF